jgi:hypothetical protein
MKPITKQTKVVRGMRKFTMDTTLPCKSWRIVSVAEGEHRVVRMSVDMDKLKSAWLGECNHAQRNGYSEADLYVLLPGEHLYGVADTYTVYRVVTVSESGDMEPCVYLDGKEPLFESLGEAQNFLDEHHGDMGDAVRSGEIPDYDFEADMIVEVPADYKPMQQS